MFRRVVFVCMLGGALAAQAETDPFAKLHGQLNAAADAVIATYSAAPETTKKITAEDTEETQAVFRGAVGRVQRLRPTIEPVLREEGVPTELAALVLVESGGQARALSPKGALGLWQLMPQTARRYGLVVSAEVDERIDVEKATRAAARYLRDLHGQFGDWKLAFAAYNAGEQAVTRALRRGGAGDFRAISARLPQETRGYVPAVEAAMGVFSGRTVRAPRQLRARVVYAVAMVTE